MVGTDLKIKHLAFRKLNVFSAMCFSGFADEGVGFPIADVRFLVKDGGWVFYADKVGYFTPGS